MSAKGSCFSDSLLEFGRRGFDGGLLAADDTAYLHGAFVDRVATGDEEFAQVLAAETDISGRFRGGDDEVDSSGLVADLDAESGSHIEAAVGIHTEAACIRLLLCSAFQQEEGLLIH